MTSRLPDLTRTLRAIEAQDAATNARGVYPEALSEAVGVAYGLDTADRNDPKTCAQCVRAGPRVPPPGCCELSFVRRMVALWLEQEKRR